MATRVFLSLGSNLGDRAANLARALTLLARDTRIEDVSSLYETEPVGVTDQPPFLNIVAAATTDLEPSELLAAVKAVERAVGRTPGPRWGPRTVDVDIILYDAKVLESETLTIPHPRMAERAFVLVPLAELAPDVVEPRSGRRVAELLAAVGGRDGVRRVAGTEALPVNEETVVPSAGCGDADTAG